MDANRLIAPGPKRILALDGGGVRGMMTLAILERVEALLAEATGRTDGSFRLAHYYDLIGGTSTGSIIATGLALGHSATELLEMYRTMSGRVFTRPWYRFGLFGPKFARAPLAAVLTEVMGEEMFESDKLLTGLAVVAKRADNGSVWVLHNNPRGRYYDAPADDPGAFPNRKIKLVSAVLASTAAPTYFQPEFFDIAKGLRGGFVDGGASPHNNPSLLLLLLATLKGYNFGWPVGDDKLLLTSVGTGVFRKRHTEAQMRRYLPVQLAVNALMSMIDDSNRQSQALLQLMGTSPTARVIDSEMGDLRADQMSEKKLLHYLRYDAQLEIDWLDKQLGIRIDPEQLKRVQAMDNPTTMDTLIKIGRSIAQNHVDPAHFPEIFSKTIWWPPQAAPKASA
jgi:hypothetical protein